METSSPPTPSQETWAEQFTASLCAQRDHAREFFAAQQARLERAKAFVEQELHRLEQELRAQREKIEQLRTQRDANAAELSKMESRLAEAERRRAASPDDGHSGAADEDLQRRYQLSRDELRQSKKTCSELQEQLASARAAATKLAQQVKQPGRLDWEAEKQRILTAWEAAGDDNDAASTGERVKIEDVVRTTEAVVASKDRLIHDLETQLERQGDRSTANASDAALINRAIDADAVVQQERERLQQLREQLQEQLRQAEIEMAMERAKIARQRAEMEEQIRGIQTGTSAPPQEPTEPTSPPGSGRWLARLGLTNADRPAGKHL